ncbi:hypothetical protein NP493_737g00002 [Ridgeia piscesae]|uniref:Uncharacterized protein n=2 Tax=Ridgeia piscesae TaxID=27915 RepID=A0AAD9KR78_RIDPI|nr:hypothetical protein NP493_737g00002 [Ridgeia piscesae]
MDLKAKRRSNAYIKLAETSMIRSQEENSDCHSCITLWHPHVCAQTAIVEEEDMTMYLEQGSAAFNALPEVSHHITA